MDIPRVGIPDKLAARLSMAEQHEYIRTRLTRRRALGLGAAGAGAALAVPLVGSSSSASASPLLLQKPDRPHGSLVVPFGRHLAFGSNPRTQIRFGWQVAHPVTRPFVRIGTQPWDLGHKVPAEIRNLHSEVLGAVAPVDQFYVHAGIDNLQPGRIYYYAVGHDGFDPADLTRFGYIGSFTTAPSRRRIAKSFTFTAFGDEGVTADALADTGAIASQDPDFHLLAGDICYADNSGSGLPVSVDGRNGTDVYDPRAWDLYLNQIEPVASRVPWMVATGNHDMEALYSPHGYGGQEARWDLPDGGPKECPSVYSFIYANVGVISLDANDVSNEIPANKGYSGGAQTTWLKQRLEFLRGQADVDFIVVFFHHCTYSTTNNHASEGGAQKLWAPLFDQYKVDLVVNGHNHVYERSDPIRAGKPTKTAPIGATVWPEQDGTSYLCVGGGGKSLYSFPVEDSYAGHVSKIDSVPTYHWADDGTKVTETVAWSRTRYTGYSFAAIDVTPADEGRKTSLRVRALSSAGTELDQVTLVRTAGASAPAARRAALSDSAS